jgi:hypothetical protein
MRSAALICAELRSEVRRVALWLRRLFIALHRLCVALHYTLHSLCAALHSTGMHYVLHGNMRRVLVPSLKCVTLHAESHRTM